MELGKNQEKWLEALESGGYNQTTGRLARRSNDGSVRYCCLGVACDISGITKWEAADDGVFRYAQQTDELPPSVMKWLGVKDHTGCLMNEDGDITPDKKTGFGCLTAMNDGRWSFKRIAKFIRENTDLIFSKSK